MPAYQGFIGGSDVTQSALANGERTINWYVERAQSPGATHQFSLYPSPGVASIVSAVESPGRAHVFEDGREFAVIGGTFYELDLDGNLTSRGTVAVDSHPATISTNGDGGGQLFLTSGNNGYVFTLSSNVFAQVRTGATTMGAHLDGYFLALDAATSTLFLSDLLDGTTWDPTQFAQRSIGSDPWVSMKVLGRYIWLFGEKTTEVWYNAGAFPFPFAPHPSGLVPFGIVAPFSATVVSGSLYWLAATAHGAGHVVQTQGFSPTVISTFGQRVSTDAYAERADAIGDTYEDLGHTFYVLTFPTADATWCYDATEALQLPQSMRWTERGTWISEENRYESWRPLYHAVAFGEHRMLDNATGTIYRMSAALGSDVDSRPIRRVRRPPALYQDGRRVFVPEFSVQVEPGLGLATGQGVDPRMGLRISKDGGKTWGPERYRSAGALGVYDQRMVWHRNGAGRRWMPEIVVSDPVPWRVLGATARISAAGVA